MLALPASASSVLAPRDQLTHTLRIPLKRHVSESLSLPDARDTSIACALEKYSMRSTLLQLCKIAAVMIVRSEGVASRW